MPRGETQPLATSEANWRLLREQLTSVLEASNTALAALESQRPPAAAQTGPSTAPAPTPLLARLAHSILSPCRAAGGELQALLDDLLNHWTLANPAGMRGLTSSLGPSVHPEAQHRIIAVPDEEFLALWRGEMRAFEEELRRRRRERRRSLRAASERNGNGERRRRRRDRDAEQGIQRLELGVGGTRWKCLDCVRGVEYLTRTDAEAHRRRRHGGLVGDVGDV